MNVILVDDEPLALDFLRRQLTEIKDIKIAGAYVNPKEGMDAIVREDVDVVFLDIQLPVLDGVELARRVLEKKPNLLIVFVTAFEQYAVDAFEINAVDYLVKPIQRNRLKETIERVRKTLAKAGSSDEKVARRPLRLFMCKQFHVEEENESRVSFSWRTARTQELFLFLLQHRNKVVHKEQIAEMLWEDVDLEKAFAQLYTTVYHIRNELKKFGDHFKLENASSGYILHVHHVEIDVHMWEEAVRSLPPLNEQTVIVYEQAMELYRASYLSDHHYVWALPEAERLDQLWIRTALEVGKYFDQQGRGKEAYEWYQDICVRYPAVEEAHFAVMKQLAKEKKSLYVHQQYAMLEHSLKEELGLGPSAYVETWYKEWEEADRLGV